MMVEAALPLWVCLIDFTTFMLGFFYVQRFMFKGRYSENKLHDNKLHNAITEKYTFSTNQKLISINGRTCSNFSTN